MDETRTLGMFLDDSGLGGCAEYASIDDVEQLPPRERHFLEWGRDKIQADAVVFQRIPINNSCFPLVYFRRLQDANPKNIAEAHRLAWNLGRAPLLFLVLPGKILVHSTFERPRKKRTGDFDPRAGLIDTLDYTTRAEQVRQTLAKYRREELLSGRFWELEENRKRFKPSTRVEKSLLNNLSTIRSRLIDRGLDSQIVHSLLGRSIFIQYLQDRKDANGHSAFPQGYLSRFRSEAVSFADVLAVKKATYDLFESLEQKFNGDIFPVTGRERDAVEPRHLAMLADFLRGDTVLQNRQRSFWPFYSFDAIPIEFISNMYEEFFHYEKTKAKEDSGKSKGEKKEKKGTFYTPHRLVEFLLDELLPWEGAASNLTVFDPACGSGIFLVEAYRRLISRWRQANPADKLDAPRLKKIMTDSLFGVDLNSDAIGVAAFSLYLTMCDYLEPRYIWSSVQFPKLRGHNLWAQDFFDFAESPPPGASKADLVVGNPPWESRLSDTADSFLSKRQRTVGDKQLAQAFLWAAPEVCKQDGVICLIAPSKGLLFNASGPNREFRKQFLSSHKVDLIVNFSALRRTLFTKAIAPAAPVIYHPTPPGEDHHVAYCCPKPSYSPEDYWHYVISSTDIQHIPVAVALRNPQIWKTAMWGGPRDWELVSKLFGLRSLQEHAEKMGWAHGEGFIVGSRDRKPASWLTGKTYVDTESLERFAVSEDLLPPLKERLFERPRSETRAIFAGPHVLFGQAPKAGGGFVAALVQGEAVFGQSIVGIADPNADEGTLGAVCVALLTDVCRYFAMMTSSRWLVERDELEKSEAMSLPLPNAMMEGKLSISYSKLQQAATSRRGAKALLEKVQEAYELDECESALVRDALEYELDYFRKGGKSDAVKCASEDRLRGYAEMLSRSLASSFVHNGKGRFPAIVYSGDGPLNAVSVILKPSEDAGIKVTKACNELASVLRTLDELLLEKHASGVYVRRDVHIYQGRTVHIAKRNQRRLWTQAAALRDADAIYADIMSEWGKGPWD